MAKSQSGEFFSIEIESLRFNEMITFEVYLYLPLNDHIIKVINARETPEKNLIERLTSKGHNQLHVRNRDHDLYKEYLKKKLLTTNHQNSTISKEVDGKAETSGQSNLQVNPSKDLRPDQKNPAELPFVPEVPPEEVFQNLLSADPEKSSEGQAQATKLIDEILKDNEEIPDQIKQSTTFEHANGVAVYSVLFAMGYGSNDKLLLQDLIAAAMIHDIGLSQIPFEVVRTPYVLQSNPQKLLYENHPSYTLQIADELKFPLSERARKILIQHHEKFNGSGYPKQLEGFDISEQAQILGLAELVESMMRGFYDGKPRTLPETIAAICEIEKHTTFPCFFNPDFLQKVMRWIQKGSGLNFLDQASNIVEEERMKVLEKKAA